MRGISVKNPERSLAICLVAGALGGAAVWSGAAEMRATGFETVSSAARIGIGLLFLILGPLMAINFWRGVRAIAALKAGKRVIARWTLSPAELAAFRDANARLNAEARNWIEPPKEDSPVEVIFGDDAALLGGEYFGLRPAGIVRYNAVRMLSGPPPMIEFGVAFTQVYKVSAVRVATHRGVVRLPVAEGAQGDAGEVVKHFERVKDGRTAANPGFWPSRRRGGVAATVLGALSFAVGMQFTQSQSIAPLIAAVAGAIVALGGVIVAVLAWFLDPYREKKFF